MTDIDAALDGFTTSALTIHDVMKKVPFPYTSVAGMASKWAHDFIGFAFKLKRVLAEERATSQALRDALNYAAKHMEDMADSLDEHITHEEIHIALLEGMQEAYNASRTTY